MKMLKNVPLKNYSTMRLGGSAEYLVEIHTKDELVEALNWAKQQHVEVLMIGGGSNIIWRDEGFSGLILVNRIMGFQEKHQADGYFLTVGSGEEWDQVVARTVAKGITGIEGLSLIPGTAGATPVQNVGAYGQEIADSLVSVEAYDQKTGKFVQIPANDCAFGYRTSRFKTTDRGRFFITAITLKLRAGNPTPPFYRTLQDYLETRRITEYTPLTIRQAVIAIRKSRLPDPSIVANNGSFFANPIIDQEQFKHLLPFYPEIPNWPTKDGRVKLPAAWLLEKAGFKNYHDAETGMGTWPAQPLVLVNEQAKTTAQLIEFRNKIIDAVKSRFGVTLEQEPELLP